MAKIEKRLDDLEQAITPESPTDINVNWEDDDLVLDKATGERVTAEEWRRRHAGEELIVLRVRWDDGDDIETIE